MSIPDFEINEGDTAMIKEWDELLDEFGGCDTGIDTPSYFPLGMKFLCGNVVTVKSIDIKRHTFRTVENIESKGDPANGNHWILDLAILKDPIEFDQTQEVPAIEWEKILEL